MKITGTVLSLLGASCLVAFANIAPAQAAQKPCCYNNGGFFNSTPSTCMNYGGRVVEQRYCQAAYDGQGYRGDDTYFSIQFGNAVFGYADGYYDHDRRWHRWRNSNERNWYRQHRRNSYHDMERSRDRDRSRRDWHDGRRDH